jgi:nucleoside-diphosphate-sugar epimerase
MYLQKSPDVTNLKEDDAYPAEPEEGYGTEKLFMEELCKYYNEDYDFETRVVRFHNVYGPLGTYEGGKEKAPAAISRKVALATDGEEIEVWGDGEQTRSFNARRRLRRGHLQDHALRLPPPAQSGYR